VLYVLIYRIVELRWEPIRRWTGWLLLPLGRNALLAFLLHIPVVYGLKSLARGGYVVAEGWGTTPFGLGSVLLLWIIVNEVERRHKRRAEVRPDRTPSRHAFPS